MTPKRTDIDHAHAIAASEIAIDRSEAAIRASAEPRTCRLCGRRFADHTGAEYCSIACEGLYRIVELIRG